MASTRALVIFEAAARLGSFSKAADEVHLSQSAVSRTILSLEQRLNCTLFYRHGKGVTLTEKGAKLTHRVRSGLHTLYRGLDDIASLDNRSDSVSILASTCSLLYWISPCLREIKGDFSNVEFRLYSSPYTIHNDQAFLPTAQDLAIFDLDLSIPDLPWPDHEYELLANEHLIPVCSPDYLAKKGSVETLAQLAELDLIEWLWQPPKASNVNMRKFYSWQHWFEYFEFSPDLRRDNLVYADYALVVNACMAGAGVALGWNYIVAPLIAQNQLVALTDKSIATGRGAYMAYPRDLKLDTTLYQAKCALSDAMKNSAA
ncbi:MAG: LysR family transcriptional regulator [Pseudomonadota bacterium]